MKQRIVFAMIMGVITTGIISFTLVSINVGFVDEFVKIWLKSWVMAYMVVNSMYSHHCPSCPTFGGSIF